MDKIIADKFKRSFDSEAEYSDFLSNYLQNTFGVRVLREVDGKWDDGIVGGIADIYIPIINAVIECKKSYKKEKQALVQLERYGRVFKTDMLFFAASDDYETVIKIVRSLKATIQTHKALLLKELEGWLKLLSKIKYPLNKSFAKTTHAKTAEEANKVLGKAAEQLLDCGLQNEIAGQLKRLDGEWFRYGCFKGWYKPKLLQHQTIIKKAIFESCLTCANVQHITEDEWECSHPEMCGVLSAPDPLCIDCHGSGILESIYGKAECYCWSEEGDPVSMASNCKHYILLDDYI